MERPRIYFLGSGAIAVPVLKALSASDKIALIGAGTQIDRPAGRRCRLVPTPVGAAAEEIGLAIDKIPSVNTPEFLERLRTLEPDIALVLSFGQLLKQPCLDAPRHGCVNIHASLLPAHRGASPIVSSILSGDRTTGVTFMRMAPALDSGPVYCRLERPLDGTEFAGELELELGKLAASAVEDVLLKICSGELTAEPQDDSAATFCRKIKKSDGIIDWTRNACEIDAMVRAYFPWPGARFVVRAGEGGAAAATVAACRVRPELAGAPGAFLSADRKSMIVACGSGGAVEILELIPSGGRRMTAAAFRNGTRGVPLTFPAAGQETVK
ncbi:MAG: methionyl-tRNA formyltransferase [Lentisphaeria bacterium]|nr:methionyl-tRNA formyltransferase [Lentisphaeria bacterium]